MFKKNIEFKLGKLQIFDQIDIDFLTQPHDQLLDASINIEDITLIYTFNFNDEIVLSEYNCDEEEKLIILLNVAKMYNLSTTMNFSLDPNNLAITPNLEVKVMIRERLSDSNDFLTKFKALIGSMFLNYSYEDIIDAGLELLNGNKFTKQIYDAQSLDMVIAILSEELVNYKDDKKNNYTLVKQHKLKFNRYLNLGLILALIVLVFTNVIGFMNNKKLNNNLDIETAYINNNYVSVIEKLQNQDVNSLSPEILYVGAVSVIRTQALNENNKNNILNNISIDGNYDLSKYWILLGQEKYDEAINLAYNINDNEYLAYAYMKKLESIKNNPDLGAEEKEQASKDIEGKLKELGYTIANKNEEA